MAAGTVGLSNKWRTLTAGVRAATPGPGERVPAAASQQVSESRQECEQPRPPGFVADPAPSKWAEYERSEGRTTELESFSGMAEYVHTGEATGFGPELMAGGRRVTEWHPRTKDGLFSHVYHYTDLLHRDEKAVAQVTNADEAAEREGSGRRAALT